MSKPRPPRIVVVGSSNTDLVLKCPRLPRAGETLLGGEFSTHAGGKGANQAVAAARAGARVAFVGAHGSDEFGRAARRALRREGVNVRHFRAFEHVPSGIALIFVGGEARENLIGVAHSANDLLSPSDVRMARPLFERADVVVCQLEVPLIVIEEAALLAGEQRVPFILNPAPAIPLPDFLLPAIHTLTPNEHEARVLTGKAKPADAARVLRDRGCRNVIVTLGERGVLVADETGQRIIPAPKVVPVDTVGAGDCFTAWLAVGIAENLPLDAAVQRAVKAASIAVTRAGAQAGMPLRGEVE